MRVTEPYTIFPRTLKTGKVVYYYQYRKEDGSRSTPKSTGCTTLASAKRFCNQLYNKGEFEKSSSIRFENYTTGFFSTEGRYYKWKVANREHISLETLLAYDKFLRNQLLPYFTGYKICALKRANIKEWVIWANSKWSAKTVNNAQTVLNIILKQAVDDEIIEYNVAQGISFRTVEKKKRELLTIEEVKQIYRSDKWWNEDNRTVFLLDIITGMRISEIVALRNEDIFEDYIVVKHSYSRKFGLGETKTYMNRYVPKPKDFILHSEKEYIFMGKKGKSKEKPLSISSYYDNFTEVYEGVGIDYKARKLATHTNRNFYISYLRAENVPDVKIKAVVGHKDEDMTDLYTYWKPEMFPEVYSAQLKLYKMIKE